MFGGQWEKDSRFRLLYCGVDFGPFAVQPDRRLRAELGIPEDAYVVGHVGRFHEQKNHEFLVGVAEVLVHHAPNVRFLLIGDGPLRQQVTKEIEWRGLKDHFVLVPDTTEVAGYMTAAMDCFILPSRYEGLGLVAVEAQAAGLPCILSDRVPAEATVDASLVQVLSLDSSAETWASALLRLRDKGARRNDPGHLELFCASRFNMDACAQDLASVYKTIARRQNPAPDMM
jgi:glycosyltransferase involved in cell wall biosynthesis